MLVLVLFFIELFFVDLLFLIHLLLILENHTEISFTLMFLFINTHDRFQNQSGNVDSSGCSD